MAGWIAPAMHCSWMDNATLVETSAVQYSSQFRFEEHAVTNFSYQVGGRAEIVSLNLGEVSP